MELMTKAILAAIPPLYAQEKLGEQAVVYVKFFTPDSIWTWYASEFDPQEGRFFGLVVGAVTEMGYFLLADLENNRGPLGLPIERDLHFVPKTVAECRRLHR
jgi:hypothetical protein